MFNVRLTGGHLYGKQLFTWLSLVVSLMASFVLSFFPLDVLDEIWDLIKSVSEKFLTYSWNKRDGLTMSKYESKGQRMILASIRKICSCTHLFNYIINFCTKIFYKFHELLQNKCTENKFNRAKISRSTQGHHQNILRQKSSRLFKKSYGYASYQV